MLVIYKIVQIGTKYSLGCKLGDIKHHSVV